MKVIDEKGRLFGKLNVIDLLALLLVAAVAVLLAVRLLGGRLGGLTAGDKEPVTIVYSVTVSGVRPESYEVVRRFVDKDAGKRDQLMTGTQLLNGYVTDCVAVPHVNYTTDANGQVSAVPSSGEDTRLDLTFTLEAVVTNPITNAVGSQEVRVGNGQYVKTAHFDFYGNILDARWSYEQ